MNELGIRLLSAIISSEINSNKGKSVFNYSAEINKGLDDALGKINNDISLINSLPFHVPSMISYKLYDNGSSIKNMVNNIIDDVDDNIKKYGYSVIVFHPQDFAIPETNGTIADNHSLNATEINDFSQLIDKILSKNMRITTLSAIVDIDN